MADYDWYDKGPSNAEIQAGKWERHGFSPVWEVHSSQVKYYLCMRGCGCVVWSPLIHMKNVCIEWENNVST